MKRFALLAFASLATFAGLYALYELRGALIVFLLSVLCASAAEPVIDSLTARGLDRRLALALTYVVALGLLAVTLSLALSSLAGELPRAADGTADLLATIHRDWPHGSAIQRAVARNVPPLTVSGALRGAVLSQLAPGAFGATKEVFGVLAETIIIFILSIYWNASTQSFERLWLSIVPADLRTEARTTWENIRLGVGDQLRRKLGQTILALVVLKVVFDALGLPYTTIPATFAAIARVLPIIGIPMAALFAALCGLAASPLAAVVAGAATLVILVLLRRVLGPWFFRAREFSPFLLVVVVIFLVDPLGVLGLLVAPPIAAAIQVVFEHVATARAAAPVHGEDIEERVASVKALTARSEAPPHVQSLVERLDALLDEVKDAARAA